MELDSCILWCWNPKLSFHLLILIVFSRYVVDVGRHSSEAVEQTSKILASRHFVCCA
jgi:hypothetical protein